MPAMPYMSPVPIGCSVVRPRGRPSRAKRSPIARSTRSGVFRPLDELIATTAPSAISAAASSAPSTLATGMAALPLRAAILA